MSFTIGDHVFVRKSSAASMVYYGEHRTEFECPCKWRNMRAQVTRIHGNYVYCADLLNPKKISAFHYNDLQLVQRAGVEDA